MTVAAPTKRSGMSEQRRHRLRLEISREASLLFWEQGVDATTGDQIAAAVGLSTRTIWRHFRSKESCAEPIVAQSVEWEMTLLRSWPPELSLEEHLFAGAMRYAREVGERTWHDDALATKMVVLAETEPALRTAWLMACDQVTHDLAEVIGKRLRLPADDLQVRVHAAAASGAMRVINEEVGAALVKGANPRDYADAPARVARAVRTATGGAVGDAIAP